MTCRPETCSSQPCNIIAEIGYQLGPSDVAAVKLYKRALQGARDADFKKLRCIEAERIADLRQRIGSRSAESQPLLSF